MVKHTLILTAILSAAFAAEPLLAQTAGNADFDGSGKVDFPDFLAFALAYGTTWSRFDLDGQGKVDFSDFLVFASFYGQTIAPSAASALDPETLLNTLHQGHPRLMLKDPELENLKLRWETDAALKQVVSDVLSQANRALTKPPLVYKLAGPRLLSVTLMNPRASDPCDDEHRRILRWLIFKSTSADTWTPSLVLFFGRPMC